MLLTSSTPQQTVNTNKLRDNAPHRKVLRETTKACVRLFVFFRTRRGTFMYSGGDHANNATEQRTNHTSRDVIKLTVVTIVYFGERLAIANISSDCTKPRIPVLSAASHFMLLNTWMPSVGHHLLFSRKRLMRRVEGDTLYSYCPCGTPQCPALPSRIDLTSWLPPCWSESSSFLHALYRYCFYGILSSCNPTPYCFSVLPLATV